MFEFPNIGSKVTSIVTSMDYIIYSSVQGKVILYHYEDYDEETGDSYSTLRDDVKDKEGNQHPILSLKLSIGKNYVYGLLDKSPD